MHANGERPVHECGYGRSGVELIRLDGVKKAEAGLWSEAAASELLGVRDRSTGSTVTQTIELTRRCIARSEESVWTVHLHAARERDSSPGRCGVLTEIDGTRSTGLRRSPTRKWCDRSKGACAMVNEAPDAAPGCFHQRSPRTGAAMGGRDGRPTSVLSRAADLQRIDKIVFTPRSRLNSMRGVIF